MGNDRKFGIPTPSQLEKINMLTKRPLEKEEVFVFPTKMVGDALLKERALQLSKSLLEVYRNDAKSGIAFMLDHPWAGWNRPKPAYPYGRTFDATLSKSNGEIEGENWKLLGDVYIVRGKEKDGVSTDAIIADIEDGTLFDVSVGFDFKNATCSICGNEYYSSKCEHWRGFEYDGQLCYIIAKPPGTLFELSGVFDGAYPTASILSRDEYGNNKNSLVLIDEIEEKDLKNLPNGIVTYGIYTANKGEMVVFFKKDDLAKGNVYKAPDLSQFKKGVNDMGESKTYTQEQVDTLVKEAVEKAQQEALATIQAAAKPLKVFMSQEQATEVLGKEYDADTILKFAKEGIQYREELIQDAIEWGIRAQGNDFPADAWRQMLSEPGRTIEAIKDFREGFKKQAEAAIPAGRASAPSIKEKLEKKPVPDEAFKA